MPLFEGQVSLNRDYDLYSRGGDGEPGRGLEDAAAQDNVVRALDGGCYGTVADLPHGKQGGA